ncbi:hypothetical protein B0H19DRAFT_1253320 [Mycena capillaripes]|nr:hypothetical protein B0H19DRAFT_1253320 [Mycena capillaripes]
MALFKTHRKQKTPQANTASLPPALTAAPLSPPPASTPLPCNTFTLLPGVNPSQLQQQRTTALGVGTPEPTVAVTPTILPQQQQQPQYQQLSQQYHQQQPSMWAGQAVGHMQQQQTPAVFDTNHYKDPMYNTNHSPSDLAYFNHMAWGADSSSGGGGGGGSGKSNKDDRCAEQMLKEISFEQIPNITINPSLVGQDHQSQPVVGPVRNVLQEHWNHSRPPHVPDPSFPITKEMIKLVTDVAPGYRGDIRKFVRSLAVAHYKLFPASDELNPKTNKNGTLMIPIQEPGEMYSHYVIVNTIQDFIYGENGITSQFPVTFDEEVPKGTVVLVATMALCCRYEMKSSAYSTVEYKANTYAKLYREINDALNVLLNSNDGDNYRDRLRLWAKSPSVVPASTGSSTLGIKLNIL